MGRTSGRLALGAVMMSMMAIAVAAGPGAVRKQAESSLLVTGKVEIDIEGKVTKVDIDQPDKLGDGIVDLVQRQSGNWRFEPVVVDGRTARARAPMTLRLVAKKAEEKKDSYAVEIRSASFGSDDASADAAIKSVNQQPPRYPRDAVQSGVSGTVFLVLRVGADGAVDDAIAEQTNLRVAGSERDMDRFRKMLEQASLAAAKSWRFAVQDQRPNATSAGDYRVRVPVDYSLVDNRGDADQRRGYGRWETYIPGPRRPIPWIDRNGLMAGDADAVADGSLQVIGSGLRLLTPLDQG